MWDLFFNTSVELVNAFEAHISAVTKETWAVYLTEWFEKMSKCGTVKGTTLRGK